MKNKATSPEFFLGANTPAGFFSIFNNLYSPHDGWFCHILKGGPGTGKSTLMKKVAEKQSDCEIIRCSSDPKSLDAVILKKSKTCIVDGTAPHVIDPVYPGVSDEIINLGEYWNKKQLKKSKKDIIKFCQENSRFHKISRRYLAAFGVAFESTARIIEENTNYEKLDSFCEKFSKKILKKLPKSKGSEKLRFLTSITPDGYILLQKAIISLCEKLIVIDDNFSVLGSYILKYLRKCALEKNYNIISCPCPFSPKEHLEALFITDLKIGIIVKNQNTSQNFLNEITLKPEKIYTKKFLNKEKISKNKNILAFNSKICKEFLKESISNLSNARKVHDKIEALYSKAMNYEKVNKIAQKLGGF